MPHRVPNTFSAEGLTCGYDGGSRVAPDAYQSAFPFTGTRNRVTIDLSGEDLIPDKETDMKVPWRVNRISTSQVDDADLQRRNYRLRNPSTSAT